jgi:hypothetical protein
MLSGKMLSIIITNITLNVLTVSTFILLNAIILIAESDNAGLRHYTGGIMLSCIMLSVIMLSGIILSGIMLSIIFTNVTLNVIH